MKRYRCILSLEGATWLPAWIRTLIKANVRWRTVVRWLTPEQFDDAVTKLGVAALITGIAVESIEEA
jgi:hypothetical protein